MNVTTIEQGNALLKIGIDKNTADMWWTTITPLEFDGFAFSKKGKAYTRLDSMQVTPIAIANYEYTPAWTLDALMDIVPKFIKFDDMNKSNFFLYPEEEGWSAGYIIQTPLMPVYTGKQYGKTRFEAVYNLIGWLLVNGHIEVVENKVENNQ